MPKLAATLASLLLITSSIGVNIARYPLVGHTVDTTVQSDAALSAGTCQPAQAVQDAEAVSLEPTPSHGNDKLATEAQQAIGTPTEKETGIAAPANPIPEPEKRQQGPATLPILGVRPLVPIAKLRDSAGGADPSVTSDELQRLPPVNSAAAITDLSSSDNSETNVYPRTATP